MDCAEVSGGTGSKARRRAFRGLIALVLGVAVASAAVWWWLEPQPAPIDPGGLVVTEAVVTDAHGSYRQTQLSSQHVLEAAQQAVVEDNDGLLTPTMQAALWPWLAEWLGTWVVDSPALESAIDDQDWEAWRADAAQHWLEPALARDLLMRVPYDHGGVGRPLLAVTGDPFGAPLRLIHDGEARFVAAHLALDSVTVGLHKGAVTTEVRGSVVYRARMADSDVIDLLQGPTSATTKADLVQRYPQLDDGEEELVTLALAFGYTLIHQNEQWFLHAISRDSQVSYTW